MVMNRNVSVLPDLNKGGNVVGEMVWWALPVGLEVSHTKLMDALNLAGLDPKKARALPSVYVFNRAVARLARGKMRDRVEWSEDKVVIQVSTRVRVPGGIDYIREGTVTLDKATGAITCPDPIVEVAAKAEFNAAIARRTTNDVTRLIKSLFDKQINKTVFPTCRGNYFLLAVELPFIESLEKFVAALGGMLMRWPIAEGLTVTNTTVQKVVVDSIQEAIMKIQNHIGTINLDSTEAKVRKTHQDLTDLFWDLTGNANLVGNELERLKDMLAHAEMLLNRQKAAAPPGDEAVPQNPVEPEVPVEPAQPTDEELAAAEQEMKGRTMSRVRVNGSDVLVSIDDADEADAANWLDRGAQKVKSDPTITVDPVTGDASQLTRPDQPANIVI